MTDKLAEELSALLDDEAAEFSARRILKEMAQSDDLQDKWDRYCLIRDALQKNVGENPEGGGGLELRADFAAQISTAVKDEPTYNIGLEGGSSNESVGSGKASGDDSRVANPAAAALQSDGELPANISKLPVQREASWVRRYGAVASVGVLMLVVWQLFQFNGRQQELPPVSSVALSLEHTSPQVAIDRRSEGPRALAPLSTAGAGRNWLTQTDQLQSQVIPVKGRATVNAASSASSPGMPRKVPNYLDGYFRIHSEQSALGSSRGIMPYARVIHHREIH